MEITARGLKGVREPLSKCLLAIARRLRVFVFESKYRLKRFVMIVLGIY